MLAAVTTVTVTMMMVAVVAVMMGASEIAVTVMSVVTVVAVMAVAGVSRLGGCWRAGATRGVHCCVIVVVVAMVVGAAVVVLIVVVANVCVLRAIQHVGEVHGDKLGFLRSLNSRVKSMNDSTMTQVWVSVGARACSMYRFLRLFL